MSAGVYTHVQLRQRAERVQEEHRRVQREFEQVKEEHRRVTAVGDEAVKRAKEFRDQLRENPGHP